MTLEFRVFPAKTSVVLLIVIQAIVLLVIAALTIPIIFKSLFLVCMSAYCYWQWQRYGKQVITLTFNALQQSWSVSQDNGVTWVKNASMHVVEINNAYLILYFYNSQRWRCTVFIDSFSLTKEKLLQLRRCTMSPEILKPVES